MNNIYTTINPNTGELTEERDRVNSWKWTYNSYKDINSNRFPFCDLNDKNSIKHALISRYYLDKETTLQSALEIHDKILRLEKIENKNREKEREINKLISAIEVAAIENKDLKVKIKGLRRDNKNLLKNLKPYISHTDDCDISRNKLIGRLIRTKCNCGLKELIPK